MKIMRNKGIVFSAAAALLISGMASCMNSKAGEEKKEEKVMTAAEKVKRGEYLVTIMGCDDCHSPKKMGPMGPEVIPETRLSGYPASRPIAKPDSNTVKNGWTLLNADLTAAVGVWGVSFAANITSDPTGIGNWTEDQFVYAIRNGKLKGLENSRPILPPMPWFVYKNMTDDDLKSVFAYLKTVKPVSNVVPAPMQIADIK